MYCDEIIKWVDYTKMEIERPKSRYLKLDNNQFEVIGLNHGYLFVGGLMNNTDLDAKLVNHLTNHLVYIHDLLFQN